MKLRAVTVLVVLSLAACGPMDSTDDGGVVVVTGGGGVAAGGGGGGSVATGGGTGTSCTTDTWSSYGASFFSSNCSNCHHHAGVFASAAEVRSESSIVQAYLRAGSMPQGYSLSTTDYNRILKYLSCGSP